MAYPDLPTLGEGVYGRLAPGSQVDHEPRILRTRFGGGYEQRTGDGLNTDRRTLTARFENLESDQADTLNNFLRERNGVKPFWHAVPGYGRILWTCERWSRQYSEVLHDTISATFTECFDP